MTQATVRITPSQQKIIDQIVRENDIEPEVTQSKNPNMVLMTFVSMTSGMLTTMSVTKRGKVVETFLRDNPEGGDEWVERLKNHHRAWEPPKMTKRADLSQNVDKKKLGEAVDLYFSL